ncbi:hypothetical protein BanimalisJ1_04590 [Bifidobacterium animalis]|nr:hypothetical protein BanimalisJ1_04590 [Bifidobacterium animalis]GEA00579.1 hypothetical protein BanimalisJ3_10370 [Bifidobacterium animalis]
MGGPHLTLIRYRRADLRMLRASPHAIDVPMKTPGSCGPGVFIRKGFAFVLFAHKLDVLDVVAM